MTRTFQSARNYFSRRLYQIGLRWPKLSSSSLWKKIIQVDWKDVESFDDEWKVRIQKMASYIPAEASVLDLGCGKEWLKDVVGITRYTGVDYVSRSPETLVCDFSHHEFPSITKDVAFISGALEFIPDPDWFLDQVTMSCSRCIISYCPIETQGDLLVRARAGWKNDLSLPEIEAMFNKRNFGLSAKTDVITNKTYNAIMVFDKR